MFSHAWRNRDLLKAGGVVVAAEDNGDGVAAVTLYQGDDTKSLGTVPANAMQQLEDREGMLRATSFAAAIALGLGLTHEAIRIGLDSPD